ncbi:Protein of unknown function (DUF4005) [Trifolium repens]|nr:protein IQ-DOMAIN [Trifolium repens]WJX20806.1 Protein of unknown function (DUF4005) [Trifolium repens]
MGFLRRLFGAKKPSDGSGTKSDKDNNKKKWSFVKQSGRKKSLPPPPPPQPTTFTQFDSSTSLERNKHAIAVAAATAAVAEAALTAARAAAEVVRLTSNGVGGSSTVSRPKTRVHQTRLPVETAAVRIQSAFRGYLARRALRALKSLVKLQALVRGHIVRKQSADMLRRMQTLVRLQTQARASRAHLSSSDNLHSFKSSLSHYPVPEEYEHPHPVYGTKFGGSSILKRCSSNANFRKIESEKPRYGSNWLDHWMQDNSKNRQVDNQKSDKILEVDTWKPHDSPSKHSTKPQNQSLSRTADNSPQTYSASSKTGNGVRRGTPFTPTRSECSWSFLGGYSGYPNYMANTESSKAKVRSQSAPRQRLEFERCSSTRKPFQGFWDVGPTNSDQDSEYEYSRSNKVSPALSRFNRNGSSNNLR